MCACRGKQHRVTTMASARSRAGGGLKYTAVNKNNAKHNCCGRDKMKPRYVVTSIPLQLSFSTCYFNKSICVYVSICFSLKLNVLIRRKIILFFYFDENNVHKSF